MSEISGLPATPSNPSQEKAHPVPPPITTPTSPTPPGVAPLYQQSLGQLDSSITQLQKIISSPSGADTLLFTAAYTSRLCSSALSTISYARLKHTAQDIIDKALTLPPDTTLVLTTNTIPSSSLLVVSGRLKALSALIGDHRVFTRLWGLLSIWSWGKKALITNPNSDIFLRRLDVVQVLANIAFQGLENGAYLSAKGVLGWSPEKQRRASLWSSRFWALHVLLEFVRLWKERETVWRIEKGKEEKETWKRQLFINTAFAPLTMHWSLENGLVSEFMIGMLGSLIGVVKTKHLWQNIS